MPPQQGIAPAIAEQGIVQQALRTPLFPSTPYEMVAEPGQSPDIRQTAAEVALAIVSRVVPPRQWDTVDGERLLSPDQLARVQERAGGRLLLVARHVIVANNVAESMNQPAFVPPGADPGDSPRTLLQSRMGQALGEFVQHPHSVRLPGLGRPKPGEMPRTGLLVVSTMATGKTAVMGTLARHAGVGKPFSAADTETNSALILVPSQALVRAYLDPESTLARWLPGVPISGLWEQGDIEDVQPGVLVATPDSYDIAMREGRLDLSPHVLRLVDEGHHADAPRMMRHLPGLADGRLVLFTGTPRKMKRYFTDLTASTARSAAEDGITRPVHLLTYQFGPEPGAAEQLTATVAARLIAGGQRVGIYCRMLRGQPDAYQARDVAARVNGTLKRDAPEGLDATEGDYVRVIASVSGDAENQEALAGHRAGTIRGYAAVKMLNEGVDVPLDAVIIVGPRSAESQWLVDQIAGRLPRPIFGADEQNPGILIEIQPREVKEGRPLASIWATYGFEYGEDIQSGMRIGPPLEADDMPPWTGAGVGFASRPPSPRGAASPNGHTGLPQDIADLLGNLEQYAAPVQPLRELTIAPVDWGKYEAPATGSRSLGDLAEAYDVPEIWLRHRLDVLAATQPEIGIGYVGVRDNEPTDERRRGEFARWYNPATVAHLEANPPTALANKDFMDVADLVSLTGVSRGYIEMVAFDVLGLTSVTRLGKSHRETRHFDMPGIRRILAEIDKIPVADSETEEALFDIVGELGNEFPYSFARAAYNNVVVHDRRRDPATGRQGFARHVSREDGARIREAFYNPQRATADDIGYLEMARRAGIDRKAVTAYLAKLPEDDKPDIYRRRGNGGGPMADHMNRAAGLAIVEKIRVHKLPPHRATLPMLSNYFVSGQSDIATRIRQLHGQGLITDEQARPERIKAGGNGLPVSTWTWEVVEALEKAGLRVRPEAAPIKYRRLATWAYDPNWAYSQKVQGELGDPKKLAALPTKDRLIETGPSLRAPSGLMDLSIVAAARGKSMDDVMTAVAATKGVRLYYEKPPKDGSPVLYRITTDDTDALDAYFAAEDIALRIPPKRRRATTLPGLLEVPAEPTPVEAPATTTEPSADAGAEPVVEDAVAGDSAAPPTETTTAMDPRDDPLYWAGYEDLREKTGCTPAAFRILLRRAGVPPEDVREAADFIARSVVDHRQAIEKQHIGVSRDGLVSVSWIASNADIHGSRGVGEDEVLAAIYEVEAERQRAAGTDELILGRSGTQVGMYLNQNMRLLVLKKLQQRAERRSAVARPEAN